jgi:hypothetical protein
VVGERDGTSLGWDGQLHRQREDRRARGHHGALVVRRAGAAGRAFPALIARCRGGRLTARVMTLGCAMGAGANRRRNAGERRGVELAERKHHEKYEAVEPLIHGNRSPRGGHLSAGATSGSGGLRLLERSIGAGL